MISFFLTVALGALMNRVRGGLINDQLKLSGRGLYALVNGKILNDVVYAAWFTMLLGLSYHGFINGAPSYTIDFNWALFQMFALTMFLGRAPGWGEYIGGMIRRTVSKVPEITHIDELLFDNSNYPVLRNMVALSLRGVMWTAALGLGFDQFLTAFEFWLLSASGLLMGPTYLLSIEIMQRIKKRDNGWQLGEWLWGGLLWGLVYCLLM